MSRSTRTGTPVPVPPARRFFQPLERFLHIQAASGIVLLLTAAVALVWANSPWRAGYEALWHVPVTLGVGQWVISQSLHFWINDGLMTIFFLVVGLEIRREMHEGALASVPQAALPVIAALGGVIAPAVIYLALNFDDPVLRAGWAVPTATDIAFAVGVLALLGSSVPPALRVLLLALAIIDDIAAIVIIALFYSHGVSLAGLAIAAAGIMAVFAFQRLGIRSAWFYVVPGAIVWAGMLRSGVHPAIGGVILGLLTPVVQYHPIGNPFTRALDALEAFRKRDDAGPPDPQSLHGSLQHLRDAQIDFLPPVWRVQLALHPWVAFGIMPLFALANAGVDLSGLSFDDAAFASVFAGVAGGLVLGKPLGIALATLISVRLGLCRLPHGIGRGEVVVLGCLGGIGFTMAIFIANLAFASPDRLAAAKFAVLVASTVAAVTGLSIARFVLRWGAAARPGADARTPSVPP